MLAQTLCLLLLLTACDGLAADTTKATRQAEHGVVPERHAPFTVLWASGEVTRVETGALTPLGETYPDAVKVFEYTEGIALGKRDGITLHEADRATDIANGELLAVSRSGDRIAYLQEQQLVIYESGRETQFPVECNSSASGVWDRSDTVLAVVCADILHIIFEESHDVFTKKTPGTAIDVTRWGEGFAVLISDEDGRVELHRTPCHQQAIFGRLEVLPKDVVQVVGGVSPSCCQAGCIIGL